MEKVNTLNSMDKIIQLQLSLESAQSSDYPCLVHVGFLKRSLVEAYKEEESLWSQRSREKWHKDGDLNTKFFYASVKASRARKRIEILKDINGNSQRSEASKGKVAFAYFTELFRSSNPGNFDEFFQGFQSKLSTQVNNSLVRHVTNQEIKDVVFSIKPSSAPGPDGMNALFFQKYWDIVGEQVSKEVKNFFEEGCLPTEWNYTYLFLLYQRL